MLNDMLKEKPLSDDPYHDWRREVNQTRAKYPMEFPQRDDVIMPQWAIQVGSCDHPLMPTSRAEPYLLHLLMAVGFLLSALQLLVCSVRCIYVGWGRSPRGNPITTCTWQESIHPANHPGFSFRSSALGVILSIALLQVKHMSDHLLAYL
jgi:hypothetical protein